MAEAQTKKKRISTTDLTVEELQDAINKHFGPGTMKRGSDPELQIVRIPTGVLAIDVLLGGGFARGRHTELFGSASVGKTALAYSTIAAAQALGLRGAFIDVERTFNPDFAGHTGIDVDELAVHEQVHGPRCIDFAETLLRSGLYDVIVIDSIASLLPLAEHDSDMEQSSYGMEQAKLMSKGLRKLTAANRKTAIVWINQTRENVGVTFGNKSITSGGRAMGFYGSTRLEMTKTETLVREGTKVDPETGEIVAVKRDPYGHRIQVKAMKEKTGARPMSQTSLVFDYDIAGFDLIADLMLIGREFGFVEKKGNSWWVDEYPKKKAVGRKNFHKFLEKHPEIAAELEGWIRDNIEPEDDE